MEALAAKAYEEGVLSEEQVRRMLELESCWDAREVLSKHGVWPGTTVEDVLGDMDMLKTIPEEKLIELWTLEKKLMNLLQVDTSSSPTWMIDGYAAAGNDSRRLFLSRFDIGTDLQGACVQPGLDFSPAPAELFGGRDMGEDALRLLGIYLAELKPVLAIVAAQSAVLGEAARWAGRMGKQT